MSVIRITKAGRLQVNFRNGDLLDVTPDASYEAWQVDYLTKEGSVMLVCPPGGQVVVFSNSAQNPADVASVRRH